jgi:hypothetical protein
MAVSAPCSRPYKHPRLIASTFGLIALWLVRPGMARDSIRENPVEPTTAANALKLLDFRSIKKIQRLASFDDSATSVQYTSRASIAAALAFYQAELGTRGWTELRDVLPYSDTDKYADHVFGKDGMVVRLTVSASSESSVMIGVSNLGNVAMDSLPPLGSSEPIGKPNFLIASYLLRTNVPSTASSCRQEMAAVGWKEVRAFDEPPSPPGSETIHFVKNAVGVFAIVAKAPQEYAGKTLLSYACSPLSSYDQPIPRDVSLCEVDSRSRRMQFQTSLDQPAVTRFYRSAYAELGWVEKPSRNSSRAELEFDDGASLRFLVVTTPQGDGGTRVDIRSVSREEAAPSAGELRVARRESRRPRSSAGDDAKEQAEALEKSIKSKIKEITDKIETGQSGDLKKAPAGTQKATDVAKRKRMEKNSRPASKAMARSPEAEQPKVVSIDAATLTLPSSAREISRDPQTMTIRFKTSAAPSEQVDYFRDAFRKLGWGQTAETETTVNRQVRVKLNIFKDGLSVLVAISQDQTTKTSVTTISGTGLRFGPSSSPAQTRNASANTTNTGERLEVQEVNGLPIPTDNTGHVDDASPYRRRLEARAHGQLDSIVAFYRRELPSRGWRETAGAIIDRDRAALSFASTGSELNATISRDGNLIKIVLLIRRPDLANKAGVLAGTGRARLMIGNQSNVDAVITIGGRAHELARGKGAQDPSQALMLDLAPGKSQIVIRLPGRADRPFMLPMSVGETWGMMILDSGKTIPIQIY